MGIQRAVLLIADIGGYTRFMNGHRMALAHAQDTVARLLEAVIDGAKKPLRLAKLEGDAALFYAPIKGGREVDADALTDQVTEIRRSFIERRKEMSINRLCSCQGCVEVDALKLKFVAHVGEVAEQKVKNLTELAGVDVIVVHRMLKNSVPVAEYVLMTEPLAHATAEPMRKHARAIEHEFEGIGRVQTYYLDLNEIAQQLPQPRRASILRRLWSSMTMTFRAVPYFLGIRKACEGFRNVELPMLPERASGNGAKAA
jgi:hypothetical protein